MVACPVSNCPTSAAVGGGTVHAADWLYGVTSLGNNYSEWESVIGLYIGTGATQGQKVAQYIGAMQGPGAGSGWSLNTDVVRGACPGGPNSMFGQPGSGIPFGTTGCSTTPGSLSTASTIGYELDLTNWDQDASPGGSFVVGLFLNTSSTYESLAGIYYGSSLGAGVGGSISWHDGILFNSDTASDNTIYDNSGAGFSFQAAGTHANAVIYDTSSGAYSYEINATKTTAAIFDNSTSPISLNITGTKSSSSIQDASTTPVALRLNGTYSFSAIYDTSAGVVSLYMSGTKTAEDINDTSTSPSAFHNTGTHSSGTILDNSSSPYAMVTQGTHSIATFDDTSTTPSAFDAAGTYTGGAFSSTNASNTYGLSIVGNQKVCLNGLSACVYYSTTAHKWYFQDENAVTLFSVAETSGNAIFKGTVTQSGTP